MITELILDKLGVFYDDVAKKQHGNSPEITYGSLIDRILADKGTKACKETFNELSEQTFNRLMRKIFPEVRLNGGQETWFYYLLSIVEYKYCGCCNTIKPYVDYGKDITTKNGITSTCKECRNYNQQGSYSRHYAAHQKSYDKNKGKIKERNSTAKYKRNLRRVPWADTEKIQEFYKNCPAGYHVDHIIPLLGKTVSGLHVLENLQYLPAKDNLKKGNRY